VRSYKAGSGCLKCGESNPVVLQFHHTGDDKEHTINKMLKDRRAWTTIMSEIDKCDVLCSNCHILVHEKERCDV
jgi:hypothetical protein